MRFFAGAFGSSPLTNAGGVIADMFPVKSRGFAFAIFAATPFLGPCLGPPIGGFIGETVGWRWLMGVVTIFSGLIWILGTLLLPVRGTCSRRGYSSILLPSSLEHLLTSNRSRTLRYFSSSEQGNFQK
jgi:MFS family permease